MIHKIYPQENGVPIYNPSGRYWIKLYNFGKLNKIEIDDAMPFNKFDELQTAKCESLEELWPTILTKAILKLFKYKFRKNNYLYDEIGDVHIIYALTGYQGERIFLKNPKTSMSITFNINNCSNKKAINLYNKYYGHLDNSNNRQIINKYFDANDSLTDKKTEEKLKVVLQNVLRDESYLKKKNYVLNFNTLNLYSNNPNNQRTTFLEEYKQNSNSKRYLFDKNNINAIKKYRRQTFKKSNTNLYAVSLNKSNNKINISKITENLGMQKIKKIQSVKMGKFYIKGLYFY